MAASTASLSGTTSTTSSTTSASAVTSRSSSATSVAPAAAVAAGSRSGVRPVICRPQSFDGHVGVYLGCCERSVTKQFLNGSQVSSPLQQVRRGAVPQAVRAQVRESRHRLKSLVNDPSCRAWIEATAPCPDEQGRATVCGSPRWAPLREPAVERVDCGLPQRHGALLAPLAEHTDGAPFQV